MPKYRIQLSAFTRVEYGAIVEAESEAAAQEALLTIADRVDGGEYVDDGDYWEENEPRLEGEVLPEDSDAEDPVTFIVENGQVKRAAV